MTSDAEAKGDGASKPPVLADAPGGDQKTWSLLMGLQRDARHAETTEALGYIVVNQTRNLIAYRQAALVTLEAGKRRVMAVSNLATIERNAPYIVWLLKVLSALEKSGGLGEARRLDASMVPDDLRRDWSRWWPAEVWWQPFPSATISVEGGLLLCRDGPVWQPAEVVLLDHLGDAFGHAWGALKARRRRKTKAVKKVRLLALAVFCFVAVGLIPVSQSVITKARIAAHEPMIVAAPVDGVIKDILVKPNAPVAVGEALFSFEAEEFLANAEVAERTLAFSEAALRRAEQQAFGDPKSKAELTVKRAEVRLRRTEAEYARSLLERITVKADRSGIAIYSDPNEYRGRPVRVGERVMLIADPAKARIAIEIPVSDAIAMDKGAKVQVFLDIDPLNPVSGTLQRASYEAAETAEGILAYQASAALTLKAGESPPRIGLRGNAKIYGERVPLALYLFRRPLAALRQIIGF